MILKLYVDILNRMIVEGSDSITPARLPQMFREDTLKLQVTLMEPTNLIVTPFSLVDITSLGLKVGIGDQTTIVAFQDTWTKDTGATVMTYTAELNLNTTELNAIFTADSTLESITRKFEIEVEDSSKFHTVYQTDVSISQDVIKNTTVDPTDVPQTTDFANSLIAILKDSETVTRVRTGDEVKHHVAGLEAVSLSGASGKVAAVKSTEDGFELVANAAGAALSADDLSDVDTTTSAPSSGQALKWDGTNWVPSSDTGATAMDNLSDADTTTAAPTTGDHLKWDGTNWVPDSAPPAHAIGGHSDVDTSTSAPAAGEVLGWDGANWVPAGAHGLKQNLTATVAPATGDDTGDGYAIGSLWIDTTADKAYLCVDATAAAAVWKETSVEAGDLDGVQSLNSLTSPNQNFVDDANVTVTSTGSAHTLGWYGTLTHERGGLEADVSAFAGMLKVAGGTTSEVKCNYTASAGPTSSDDTGSGYIVSSLWIDTTNDRAFMCVDNTASAAVWKDLTEAVTSLAFKTLDVNETDSGFSWGTGDVVADDAHDTLKIVAGTNITIASDPASDAIRITASGGGGSGTVTSVAVSGSDGIDVDSGSPITSTGTIALGLSNIANAALANSSVNYGGVTVALGASDTTPAFDLADATGYEGTAIKSTGESGGTKYLREDGGGTSSWQAVSAGVFDVKSHWLF